MLMTRYYAPEIVYNMTINALKDKVKGDTDHLCKICKQSPTLTPEVKGHEWGSSRGRTGRIRFPKDESWVMKKPDECACACCKAVFCCAAKCCCSALSLNSFILGRESEMLAPGVFMDWLVWMSRFFSRSNSARMATLALLWKAGALVVISIKTGTTDKT